MRIRFLLSLMILLVAGETSLRPAGLPSLVLTAKENGLENQPEVVCSGRVHGYLRLAGPEVGPHLLESFWTSPAGKVVAHSRTSLTFDPPGRSTAYIWLDFPERSGGLGTVDPQLDQELLSYAGIWHVEARWDDKHLVQSTFKVRCP